MINTKKGILIPLFYFIQLKLPIDEDLGKDQNWFQNIR